MGIRAPASVNIRSKYSEKHSVTLVKNDDFMRGRGPGFFASCFLTSPLDRILDLKEHELIYNISTRHIL